MFGKAKNKAENTDITEMMPETKKEKKPWDKEKKKKVRRRVIAGVLAVLVVAFFVRNSLVAKNAAPMVTSGRHGRGGGTDFKHRRHGEK